MPKGRQLLSRMRRPEFRAAELLRILYESRPGLGERIHTLRVYDVMVARRAIELDLNYHQTMNEGRVNSRISINGYAAVHAAKELLEAMGLIRKLSVGVYAITELGREEAELWFPELRTPTNS